MSLPTEVRSQSAEQHPGYPALLFVEGQEGGVGLA